MKTYVHFRYVSQFFLEREIFHNKFYRKSKGTYYVQEIFFKSCPLRNNIRKCKSGKATNNNRVMRMRTACWITKVTHTHTHTHTQTHTHIHHI